MRRLLLAPALLALALSACGLPSRLASSPAEYESYRATRADYTPEARLHAAQLYLGVYPTGRFADEVRRRFETEEAAFYRAKSLSAAGLVWYLHVLPDGPHASEASLLLSDLEKRAAQERSDELLARGRSIERRLALAATSRRQTSELLVGWIASLTSSDGWGKRTHEQPPEIVRALRTEPNGGRCDERRCLRTVTTTFSIPQAGGGLDERAAVFDLVLDLDGQGRVVQGALQGPGLFSRLYEASLGRPLPADMLEARAEAVSHALEVLAGAAEAVTPAGRCDRPIKPPEVLRRQCDGWLITAIAGDQPTDDDVIRVAGPR